MGEHGPGGTRGGHGGDTGGTRGGHEQDISFISSVKIGNGGY